MAGGACREEQQEGELGGSKDPDTWASEGAVKQVLNLVREMADTGSFD